MSVLVIGTIALDSIKTPYSENPRLLGGSASHAAVAASFFSSVSLVGVVGSDFPENYLELYNKHSIDIRGLERKEGQTFFWAGEYEVNMNNRQTLETILGVIENWLPDIPDELKEKPYVLLANCEPKLQRHILQQVSNSKSLVVADTMDLWLNIARDELLALLKEIDCLVLNDSEARQLTKENNAVVAAKHIHELGPKYVIVKKGEHGAILSAPKGLFIAPAFPLSKLTDPTGAGDSFVGGLIGYLAAAGGDIEDHFRKAVIHGSVTASFCCEGFGLSATTDTTREAIDARVAKLETLVKF
ncbi:MAG: Bifunctional ribokinase/ribose-5-phosphate isomerase A [Verrucomicrobia subdivision 3 bacterium]|nr:Bifunctional ribokinase/ribose-5-phosphate isomerase A [Limisphaerales bacterium]MCS1415732.1 Bifunctional ribokinase/ribose-5-phosphate isomerase A [Limisphaerales bacterium]